MDGTSTPILSPLRRITLEGDPYKRDARTESALLSLKQLSRDEIVRRCELTDRKHPDYVTSECLMYLVRECRHENSNFYFERLYKILSARVLAALPRAERAKDNTCDLKAARTREEAFDRFKELLASDRLAYNEKLDYYEVRFDGAVANLRRDAFGKAQTEESRSRPFEGDPETGELPVSIELAARDHVPFDAPENWTDDYRSQLARAISSLTPEQIRIVHMLSLDIPIDSKDADTLTIAKALGRSEKTIRNQRDKAFAAIRAFMAAEDSR